MKINPFEYDISDYDSWYVNNDRIYRSELNAIKNLLEEGKGIEIGCGTGRFTDELGIEYGLEISLKMIQAAKSKHIKIIRGDAHILPIKSNFFDYVVYITTLCFLTEVDLALKEGYRILKNKGYIIAAIIDKDSFLGKLYEEKRKVNKYYKYASFYSTDEILELFSKNGFGNFTIVQTVFDFDNKLYSVKSGYGEGGFVVIKAYKI